MGLHLIEAARLLRTDHRDLELDLWLAATGEASGRYLEDLKRETRSDPWINFGSSSYQEFGNLLSRATAICVPNLPHPSVPDRGIEHRRHPRLRHGPRAHDDCAVIRPLQRRDARPRVTSQEEAARERQGEADDIGNAPAERAWPQDSERALERSAHRTARQERAAPRSPTQIVVPEALRHPPLFEAREACIEEEHRDPHAEEQEPRPLREQAPTGDAKREILRMAHEAVLAERSPLFDEPERAALRFARDASLVPNEVTPTHFAELRAHWDEGQVVEIAAVIGRTVPFPLLQAVSGRAEGPLVDYLRRLRAAVRGHAAPDARIAHAPDAAARRHLHDHEHFHSQPASPGVAH